MNRKSKVRGVFETSMDTIWNSVSFPYKWRFISSFGAGAVISEQVMDLIDCISQLSLRAQGMLFGYEVAYESSRIERAQGDSGLVVNFLPKRVGA
jgi:hypothetical protein